MMVVDDSHGVIEKYFKYILYKDFEPILLNNEHNMH